jgi:membrane-associated phospholipid phosphatase
MAIPKGNGGLKISGWFLATLIWSALFCGVTLLVQGQVLAPADRAGMALVAAHRETGLADGMNWIFRLGFAAVDAGIAVVWAGVVLWRQGARAYARRPYAVGRGDRRLKPPLREPWGWNARFGSGWLVVRPALAPLVVFAVIGVQSGLRLVVDQPAPGATYELQRAFAPEPVSGILDRTDAAARGTFVATTAPIADSTGEGRGSYPSGHAARTLFLALLAARWWTLRRGTWGMGRWGEGGTQHPEPRTQNPLSTQHSALSTLLILSPQSSFFAPIAAAIALAVAAAVGYSALYFGYHWPSDLLGGYLLGMAAYPAAARLLSTEHSPL